MKKKLHILLLLLPFLGISALVCISVWNVAIQSLGYIPAFGLTNLTLRYYAEVFRNPDFVSSVWVSLKIALWSAVFACILGVVLAMALIKTRKSRGATLSQAIHHPHNTSFRHQVHRIWPSTHGSPVYMHLHGV